jgi:SHS2 domain-containing protein
MRAAGQSLRKIAKALTAEGIRTKKATSGWSAQAISDILSRDEDKR